MDFYAGCKMQYFQDLSIDVICPYERIKVINRLFCNYNTLLETISSAERLAPLLCKVLFHIRMRPKISILFISLAYINKFKSLFLCRQENKFSLKANLTNVVLTTSHQIQDLAQEEIHFYFSRISNSIEDETFHAL